MNENELPCGISHNVYTSILCLTSEERLFRVNYCEKEFLDRISYNCELETVEDYLIRYLNEYEYNYCDIEDEEYGLLEEPINERLKSEALIMIELSKFKL